MDILVEAIMTSPVVSIEPSASIGEAARLMLSKKISGLPVILENGTLVGIVSEGDFLRRRELGTMTKRSSWLEFFVSPGKVADEYVHANGRRVAEVMSTAVYTIGRDSSLDAVVELMTRHHVKRVPVLEDGKVIGIVARSDLLRALLRGLPPPDAKKRGDEEIRRQIVGELADQNWSGTGMIHVNVKGGVAELTGEIFDERERQAARVVAENVAGVVGIVDHLLWIEPLSGMVVDPPLS